MEGQASDGENICKSYTDKGLVSRLHKGPLKLNNKKTHNRKKWTQDLNGHFTKEDIEMENT